jgi:hypothetical protein
MMLMMTLQCFLPLPLLHTMALSALSYIVQVMLSNLWRRSVRLPAVIQQNGQLQDLLKVPLHPSEHLLILAVKRMRTRTLERKPHYSRISWMMKKRMRMRRLTRE